MRQHWKEAPPHIQQQIIFTFAEHGAYNGVLRAMDLGYSAENPPTPLHDDHARFLAAGDPVSANAIANSDVAKFADETRALALVAARRDWARDSSIEHDQLRAKLALEAKLMEERERFAVARANELRDQEETAKHAARIEVARREWDAAHQPANGAAQKEKRA